METKYTTRDYKLIFRVEYNQEMNNHQVDEAVRKLFTAILENVDNHSLPINVLGIGYVDLDTMYIDEKPNKKNI